jgi:manganese/iron transport system permease protein
MSWLLEPFQYAFMINGLIAATLVSLTCAAIGVFVVLRRMAFIGDALAHTILPGLVVAYLNQWNLFAGAIIAGIATALGIGWLSRRQEVREDTAIGILFTGMFALGILLISAARSFRDFTHILFGNLLGVTVNDLILIGTITATVLSAIALFYKELELTSFDPTHAQIIGLNPDIVRYGLLILLALTVVTSIQAVGVVLTSALLITPAATAALLTQRLRRMIVIATFIALASSLLGLYASYYFGVSSGASIVLTNTACFGAAWIAQNIKRTRL